jgi:membrane protein implicated in regulation of membrane protease activity
MQAAIPPLAPLVGYISANGPVFWLVVAAAFLTLESISGRAWWTWVAAGAGVAALLTLWLDLSVLLEFAAFVAASLLGLLYSLQMRLAAARLKLRQQAAQRAAQG